MCLQNLLSFTPPPLLQTIFLSDLPKYYIFKTQLIGEFGLPMPVSRMLHNSPNDSNSPLLCVPKALKLCVPKADQPIKLDEAIHNASTCNEIRESLLGHTTEKSGSELKRMCLIRQSIGTTARWHNAATNP